MSWLEGVGNSVGNALNSFNDNYVGGPLNQVASGDYTPIANACQFLDDAGTAMMISDPIPNGSLPPPLTPVSYVDNAAGGIIKEVGAVGKAALGSEVASATWKSVKKFGHTFSTHGEGAKNLRNLTGRAASTAQEQGQWLSNQGAADLLDTLGEIAETTTVSIPEGLGQVVTPSGEIVAATKAVVVPSSTGIKTAYPTR